MVGLVLGSLRRAGDRLRITLPAVALLFGAALDARADPRIDQNTAAAPTATAGEGILEQHGLASWYGTHWRGRRTASGVRFDDRRLTAASLSLPLASRARVTNLQNGRSVEVLVNDRGPYVEGRIMDLSTAAAAALGMTRSGLAEVAIRVLNGAHPAG